MIDHYEEMKYINRLEPMPTEYVVKQVQIAWVENIADFEIIMLGAYRNADDAWAVLNKWHDDNVLNAPPQRHRKDNKSRLDGEIYLHCDSMELK